MSNHEEPWEYWNKTRRDIPDDLNAVDDKKIAELLGQWEGGVWTEMKPDSKQILANIKLLPEIHITVTKWIMDRIKECTDAFVNQRWLSSIALAGAISEYLSFYLLQEFIKKKGMFPLTEHSGLLKQQHDRIVLLRKLDIIEEPERVDLHEINELRNKYLHIHTTDYSRIKDDNLTIIKKLITLLSKYPVSA